MVSRSPQRPASANARIVVVNALRSSAVPKTTNDREVRERCPQLARMGSSSTGASKAWLVIRAAAGATPRGSLKKMRRTRSRRLASPSASGRWGPWPSPDDRNAGASIDIPPRRRPSPEPQSPVPRTASIEPLGHHRIHRSPPSPIVQPARRSLGQWTPSTARDAPIAAINVSAALEGNTAGHLSWRPLGR